MVSLLRPPLTPDPRGARSPFWGRFARVVKRRKSAFVLRSGAWCLGPDSTSGGAVVSLDGDVCVTSPVVGGEECVVCEVALGGKMRDSGRR